MADWELVRGGELIRAALERERQERRARPAYRERWLGSGHGDVERYARRLLAEARPGMWLRFYAASPHDASAADQCLRYIVRQERPAESVRVEWLRSDGSWQDGFPRPVDRHGHGDIARVGREVREAVAGLAGRDGLSAGTFGAELRELARERDTDGAVWYVGSLRLGPKRGTVAPPAPPRPDRSASAWLQSALTGDGE